jgi:glucokinase
LERPTEAAKGADTVYGNILKVVRELLNWAQARSLSIKRLGVSTAGQVDPSGSIAYATDTFPGWTGFPLKAKLEAELGLEVFVENDAHAAAWGEKYFGIAQGIEDFIMLTLGTGIGGVFFTKGSLYTGSGNLAGLLGHMTIDLLGVECNCGGRGCLEQYASATGIVRQAREAAAEWPDGALAKLLASQGDFSAKDVFTAAGFGEPAAKLVVEKAAEYLGAGIGSLLNLLNPELVVLAGGVSEAGEPWLELVSKAVKGYCTEAARRGVSIKLSKFPSHCGLFGAAAVAQAGGITRL